MKASLLSMLAKLAFAFEGGAVAVPGSTIRVTTAKTYSPKQNDLGLDSQFPPVLEGGG